MTPEEIKSKIEAKFPDDKALNYKVHFQREGAEYGYSLAEQEIERLKALCNKLKELCPYHINPYNLGEQGEISKIINQL